MLRIIAISIGFTALIVVGVATAVYFVGQKTSHPSDQTAAFLPYDTSAYFSVNTRPGADQLIKFAKILSIYEDIPSFEDASQEAYSDIEEELYFDLESVIPWLGPELAVGVLDIDAENASAEAVVFLGTNDPTMTESLVKNISNLAEEKGETDVEIGTYESFPTYRFVVKYSEYDIILAITDEYLVMATNERLLEQTIDLMINPGESLESNPIFREAQTTMQDPRFASFYLNVDEVMNSLSSALDAEDRRQLASYQNNLPTFLVGSASFLDMGIKFTTTSDVAPGTLNFPESNTLTSAAYLPSETVFMMSLFGLSQMWAEIEKTIRDEMQNQGTGLFAGTELNPELAVGIMMGLNFAEGFFEWMTGETTFAVIGGEPVAGSEPIIQFAGLIDFDDIALPESMVQDLSVFLTLAGASFEPKDVGGMEVMILGDGVIPGGQGYSLGYTFYEDRLAIGTTEKTLLKTIDASNGAIESLNDSPVFTRLMEEMAGGEDFFLYLNIGELASLIGEYLDEADGDEYQEEMAPFIDPLEAFILGLDMGEQFSKTTMVITFDR
jgi:hypothetical protein